MLAGEGEWVENTKYYLKSWVQFYIRYYMTLEEIKSSYTCIYALKS